MSKQPEQRKFPSGISIMRRYIPDYEQEPLTIEQQATQAAQKLVSEFRKSLHKQLKEKNIPIPARKGTQKT